MIVSVKKKMPHTWRETIFCAQMYIFYNPAPPVSTERVPNNGNPQSHWEQGMDTT